MIRDAGICRFPASPAGSPRSPPGLGTGASTADDLSGGSFTITNTGSRGALFDTPILNAPELGDPRPRGRRTASRGSARGDGDDRLGVRSMAYLALTYDHRLVDGADAARYLATVKPRLEPAPRAGRFPREETSMTTMSITPDRDSAVLSAVPAGLVDRRCDRPATGRATLPVHDPSTGEVLTEVADAAPEDAAGALDAAVAAQEDVGSNAPRERGEILRRASSS